MLQPRPLRSQRESGDKQGGEELRDGVRAEVLPMGPCEPSPGTALPGQATSDKTQGPFVHWLQKSFQVSRRWLWDQMSTGGVGAASKFGEGEWAWGWMGLV